MRNGITPNTLHVTLHLVIFAIMTFESDGRTMLAEKTPMTSGAGAMGLMQLMPDTWRDMRIQYDWGNDPYNPHDNIMAGAAYMKSLYRDYGYPGLFAAYNDGPGMLEAHRRLQQMLPAETTTYVLNIASILSTGARYKTIISNPGAKLAANGTAAPLAVRAIVFIPAAQPRTPNGDDDDR